MKRISIVDAFSLINFQKEYNLKDYEVKASLFLTYSVKPRVILALIHELFYQEYTDTEDEETSMEKAEALLNNIVKDLLDRELGNKQDTLKDKFAVYYNNGSRSTESKYSIADAAALQFAYSVDMEKASFHPKVYIAIYGPKDAVENRDCKTICRIMIGSHNLSDSHALEYGYCFDRPVRKAMDNAQRRGDWKWLESLLKKTNEKTFLITDQVGTKCFFDSLPVVKEIMGYECCEGTFPEILTRFNEEFEVTDASRIFSPFVTQGRIKKINDVEIYTTAFELEKRGYEPASDGEEGARRFFVFSPDEKSEASKYSIPHYKIYHIGEAGYVGSLNYTESAFNRNKEVLVKISKEKIEDFESAINVNDSKKCWYKEKYYKYSDSGLETEPDLYENFRNWIRSYFSIGHIKLFAIKNDDGIILSLDVESSKDMISKKNVWNAINGIKGDDVPDDFNIYICPENLNNQKSIFEINDLNKTIEWTLSDAESDLLRSSTIYFYLVANEEHYPPYCRSYPLLKGGEILNEKVNVAMGVDWFRMESGEHSASETTGGEKGKSTISTAGFKRCFSMESLDKILTVTKEERNKKIKRMQRRLSVLEGIRKNEKYQKKVFKMMGCMPADILIWEKMIEQSHIVLKSLGKELDNS
ncbi:MAG: hypothetical protein IKO53_04585 [Lachnospiraceae bacterium]|nr:hypothetical protein [Lachnospiraceae bacterium]